MSKIFERVINCPNCGAPYDGDEHKCPYCGTICIDMTYLNFDNPSPIFLKLKTHGIYITQKVLPRLDSINLVTDSVTATGAFGDIFSFKKSASLETNLSFDAISIQEDHGVLCTIRKAD